MAGMDARIMANMPPEAIDSITPEQTLEMQPDVAGMMPDDGGMGALGDALGDGPTSGEDFAEMDPAAGALAEAMDASQIQGGDSAPADAAAMDQAAAGVEEVDASEVEEASEAPATPDEPIV